MRLKNIQYSIFNNNLSYKHNILNMKKNLIIIIVLLGIPIICSSQFFPTGGFQGGGHGSGGDAPTGIYEEYLVNPHDQLWIYPNPTSAVLNIEADIVRKCSIEITSMFGQLIFNGKMEGTSHQIDLSAFQKGVYYITIRSEDFIKTKKVIKF